jgi:hypothetical protein
MQGMIRSRSVERGEVDFRVGNNARVAALSVGTWNYTSRQDLYWK